MKALFRCIAFLACLVILLGIFSRMFCQRIIHTKMELLISLQKGIWVNPSNLWMC